MTSSILASPTGTFSARKPALAQPTWDDTDHDATLFEESRHSSSAAVSWGSFVTPSGPLLFWSDLASLDARRIAHLRFEDGDVVVKLSPRPDEWLLLHREVVGSTMLLLSPYLRRPWTTGEAIQHPHTGETVEVFTLSLKHADGTLLLAGEDFLPFQHDPLVTALPSSALFEPGYPMKKRDSGSPLSACLNEVAAAHIAIFCTIYSDLGQDIPALRGMLFPCQQHFDVWDAAEYLNDDLPFLSLLLAYSHYYGCERLMCDKIFHFLSSFTHLPEAMSLKPISWLRLGKKMQSKAIYFDALRHLLAGQRYSWRIIGLEMGLNAQQAERTFLPRLRDFKAAEQDLLGDLEELAVVKFERWSTGEAPDNVDVSVENLDRLGDAAMDEPKYDAMARGAFGVWLFEIKKQGRLQHEMEWERSKKTRIAISLSAIYTAIMNIETPLQPECIYDEQAVKMSSRIWGTDDATTSTPIVRDRVAEIIKDARRTIYAAYRTKTELRDYDTRLTYRCSASTSLQAVASAGMPYLGLDESEIPWTVTEVRGPPGYGAAAVFAKGVGKVSLELASRRWLRACGLGVQGEETVEEILEDALIMP